jgi:hypothetical protein
MKSLMSLWRVHADEAAWICGTSADRDIKTAAVRSGHEGDSFFEITLPQFCKDFERSLELGKIDSSLFKSFAKRNGLPLFLGGFLSQVFGPEGTLLDTPSVDCIDAVRQITSVFGKIESPCSKKREARAMRRYVEIEAEMKEWDSSSWKEYLPLFQKATTLLFGDVFADVESKLLGVSHLRDKWDDNPVPVQRVDPFIGILHIPDFREYAVGKIVEPPRWGGGRPVEGLVPRHGPGATADRLRGNAKFDVVVWPQRLERVFPYGDYALPGLSCNDQLDRVQFLEPGKERPVKVVSVPKTKKTPRIIAEEPTAMQYMQQAISNELVTRVEHTLKRASVRNVSVAVTEKFADLGGHVVGFTNQEPNRLMAREGSHYGNLATLDLSEASDRVFNQHVELLFSRFPRLSEAVQATRSLKADVPGHGIISLTKFSSMGSALCFPVEAMVFSSIVFAAIAYERRVPLTRGLIISLRGKVRVYGDDIVVPVEYVHRVIQFLEAFGLVVNKDKSFWNGKFRESCGGDFYDGQQVTPVRLRQELPRSLEDVSSVVGLVAFRNLLYWKGYWKTARYIDRRLRDLFKGHYPVVDETAVTLGRESVLAYQPERFHPDTHAPQVLGARVRHKIPDSPVSGDGALMKFLIKRGITPSQDAKHLERSGRPYASRIKIGWTQPY